MQRKRISSPAHWPPWADRERQEGMITWAYRGCILILVFAVIALVGSPTGADSPPAALAGPSPDLAPVAIQLMPNAAHEGEFLRARVTIVNHGDVAAWAAAVLLYDVKPNGDVDLVAERGLDSSVGPDSSVVITMPPFIAAGVGAHALTVRLTDVMPADEDPTNDVLSQPLTVLASDDGSQNPPPANGIRTEALESAGLAGLIVIVVIAFLGLAVAVAGRGRPGRPMVPPPPEPPDEAPPPIWPP